ncbi:MAG: hypothetical protein DME55_07690 [Verrucomicrobia bacterium]|nr:MAG: hypothetical protein DME55_07690 [Verrucomicrobiota bacterium]
MRTPSLTASKKRRNAGRPSKKTDEKVKALMQVISTGAPYRICCAAVGVSYDSFMTWKREDWEFDAKVEAASAKAALRLLGKIEKQADQNFAASSWILERRFPEIFSRPEVQLNLIQQNNTVENSLVINITGTDAARIEAQAEPIRAEVAAMFEQYRPLSGGGENAAHEVEAEPVAEQPLPKVADSDQGRVITHRDGDENSQAFWRILVSARPERLIAKDTAEFAVRTLLSQTLGYKAHRMEIDFGGDPVTLEEMFSRLEELCGGSSCWQAAQRLAGYTATS